DSNFKIAVLDPRSFGRSPVSSVLHLLGLGLRGFESQTSMWFGRYKVRAAKGQLPGARPRQCRRQSRCNADTAGACQWATTQRALGGWPAPQADGLRTLAFDILDRRPVPEGPVVERPAIWEIVKVRLQNETARFTPPNLTDRGRRANALN